VSVGVEPRFGKRQVLIERAPFVLNENGLVSILACHLTVDTKARVSMKHTRQGCFLSLRDVGFKNSQLTKKKEAVNNCTISKADNSHPITKQ